MAGETSIGPKIEIVGQAEFKRSLAEIERGFKVNQSEIAKVTAEYDKNDKSMQALTARNEALQKAIYTQTERVETLKAALNESAREYGEADKRTMSWQAQLNNAEAKLITMNKNLEENEEALKNAEKGTSSLGDAVRGLANVAGLDIPPAFDGMISKLDGVSKSGAALTGVLVGITTALYRTTMNTKDVAGEIDELSHKTGMSVEKIQELNYAAEFLEVSAEDIGSSIAKMTKNMDIARSGTGDAAEAFKELRVSIKNSNGQLKDSETVFYKTIDALGKVKNETDRDALSMAIFGKSAMSLNNLILEGSDNIKGYAAEAQNMGYVMDKDTIDKFNDLDDAMVRWNKSLESTKNSMATALLPVLTSVFEAFGKIPTPVLQTTVVLAGIIASIVLTVKTIKELTATGNAITGFFKLADGSMDTTKIKILAVVAALVALAAIIAVIIGKSGEIQSTFASIGNSVGKINGQVNNVSTRGAYNKIPAYAKGTTYHPGGRAIVGEEGPEIVDLPRGSRVYPHGTYPQVGGDTYYITIDAKNVQEFNDIVRMAKNQRRWGVQGVKG